MLKRKREARSQRRIETENTLLDLRADQGAKPNGEDTTTT